MRKYVSYTTHCIFYEKLEYKSNFFLSNKSDFSKRFCSQLALNNMQNFLLTLELGMDYNMYTYLKMFKHIEKPCYLLNGIRGCKTIYTK